MLVVVMVNINRFIKPFNGFQMLLIDGIKANRTPNPFQVIGCTEKMQNARKAENILSSSEP